ncbi:MAG TPA: hypothetical protein VF215_17825 [Thermoanaerobaculia bacterium]
MRPLLAVLLSALLASAAMADEAVAGKTHILMSSPQNAFWVPLDGGPVQQIYPGYGVATNVATDGERFLIANGAQVISLYEEGALQPLHSIELDDSGPQSRSYATWDGSRYVVAWMRPDSNIHVATLSPEGTLIAKVRLDTGINISGLVANGDRLLLLEEAVLPPFNPGRRRLRAILLNHDLQITRISTLGEVPELFVVDGSSFQHVAGAVPFGDGFYVAWHQEMTAFGQRTDDSKIVGTRINRDGDSLDLRERIEGDQQILEGRTLVDNVPEAFDTDLVNMGDYVVAVVKRENYVTKAPLTATFITPDGFPLSSRKLADVELQDDRRTRLEVVRLRDGRTVAVSVVDFKPEIIPLDTSLAKPPRRRAVRQ